MSLAQAPMAALVAQMPDADAPGRESTFTGPEPQAAEKIFAQILAGGPKNITELIRLVRAATDPDFEDYRAEYVLHGLVVYAGHPEREPLKRVVAEVLAAQVGRSELSKGVRGCILRELRWIGGPGAVAAIAGQLQDEDLCPHAVSALVAIGSGAAESLRQALPQAKGKARLAIIQALGVLGDAAAVDALKPAVADDNREVRIVAAWGLAHIGDAGSADLLIKAADSAEGWERIQAVKNCLLLAENLMKAGKQSDAARIYTHLQDTRSDASEQYVREAAARGLAAAK